MFWTPVVPVIGFAQFRAFGPYATPEIIFYTPLISFLNSQPFASMSNDPIMLLSAISPGIIIGYFIGKFNIWILSKTPNAEIEE